MYVQAKDHINEPKAFPACACLYLMGYFISKPTFLEFGFRLYYIHGIFK